MNQDLKFFIVDDDPICRLMYQQHLTNLGYADNHSFANGLECIKQLKNGPDVVLLDYQMNPYNGIEVLKMVKQYNKNIFSLIISGQKDVQIAFEAAKYGAFGYIVKGEKEFDAIGKTISKIIAAKKKADKANMQRPVNEA